MTTSYVNGMLFKKMITNGAINLKNHYQQIDQLNVFPVPDGDTGTNMQMTMMAGIKELENCQSSSIVDMAKSLSRGLLMGARGNSGVILSQFFRGIYVGLKGITTNEISVSDLINCFISGYQVAYKAVMEPVEGTILTVVRESAQKVETISGIETINDLFDLYIAQANISLENTPNLLPVLKEAGVVDSGGAGFIKVIEGMIMALNGNILSYEETKSSSVNLNANTSETNILYGYCTEFIVQLKDEASFDENELRSPLSLMGDSLVLVKDEDLCKVHVHTNNPGRVLELAIKYGDFVTTKIENMRLQHSEFIVDQKPKEFKKYALVAVCFGEGIKRTFTDLGVDKIIDGGQTMNPACEDFVKAIDELNAENIIIIPNNSNIILAAEQSKKIIKDKNIAVLHAKTVAQGYASLMAFDPGNSLEENIEEMTNVVKNTVSGEVTYAIRDTEINGVKIKSGDYMGICNGKIVVSTLERLEASKQLLESCIDEDSTIATFFYGDGTNSEELKELQDYCSTLNEDIEVELIEGNQDIYSYIISVE